MPIPSLETGLEFSSMELETTKELLEHYSGHRGEYTWMFQDHPLCPRIFLGAPYIEYIVSETLRGDNFDGRFKGNESLLLDIELLRDLWLTKKSTLR
jgi:hypothetical protein